MSNWNVICLSPCILMLIGLALVAGYAFLDHIYGPQGAKLIWKHELIEFAFAMTFATIANLALNAVRDQNFEIIVLSALLVSCAVVSLNIFAVRRRIQNVDQVLFRCTERKRAAATILAIMILLALVLVMAMFILVPRASYSYQVAVILFGLLIVLSGVNAYYRTRSPLIATNTGIIVGAAVHSWDKIRFYYIAPSQRYLRLILRLEGWFPLTNTVIVPLEPDEVDKVSALLAERLPAIRQSKPAPSDVSDTVAKPV